MDGWMAAARQRRQVERAVSRALMEFGRSNKLQVYQRARAKLKSRQRHLSRL